MGRTHRNPRVPGDSRGREGGRETRCGVLGESLCLSNLSFFICKMGTQKSCTPDKLN